MTVMYKELDSSSIDTICTSHIMIYIHKGKSEDDHCTIYLKDDSYIYLSMDELTILKTLIENKENTIKVVLEDEDLSEYLIKEDKLVLKRKDEQHSNLEPYLTLSDISFIIDSIANLRTIHGFYNAVG